MTQTVHINYRTDAYSQGYTLCVTVLLLNKVLVMRPGQEGKRLFIYLIHLAFRSVSLLTQSSIIPGVVKPAALQISLFQREREREKRRERGGEKEGEKEGER